MVKLFLFLILLTLKIALLWKLPAMTKYDKVPTMTEWKELLLIVIVVLITEYLLQEYFFQKFIFFDNCWHYLYTCGIWWLLNREKKMLLPNYHRNVCYVFIVDNKYNETHFDLQYLQGTIRLLRRLGVGHTFTLCPGRQKS